MFKPHQATPTPVKVYRASDAGAPQLKYETGSLKNLIKTCLINGYGEGDKRKEPVGGWQMFEETANAATFFSEKTNGIGLTVDNSQSNFITAHMAGGSRFEQYLSYSNKDTNRFSYAHNFPLSNWMLVGCDSAFILILPESNRSSQILYFGKMRGIFEDEGNITYVNTSYSSSLNWDTGTFGAAINPCLIIRSRWREGGTLPLSAVVCDALSPFANTKAPFPDALYQNATASAIVLAEEKDGAVRGTLPALFWCYHDLQGKVNELDTVDMGDGQQYIKLNLHDGATGTHCFVLNIQEWEL